MSYTVTDISENELLIKVSMQNNSILIEKKFISGSFDKVTLY